jgi:ATP-binding protein involved in chromosome partitioning
MSYFIAPDTGVHYDIFGHGGARKAADDLGIDFLGEVPIEAGVREGGDKGIPIVYSSPGSASAIAIEQVAGNVAARLSVLQRMGI